MVDNSKALKRHVRVILNKFDYEKKELDPRALKELKTIVRNNDTIIPELADVLITSLQRKNCDERSAIVQLANYFFQRSHKFRVNILSSFQDFMLLTLETDPIHCPLPPPAISATALKNLTLQTIYLWVEKFASSYPILQSAERFLKSSKHFDFHNTNVESVAERNRIAQQRFHEEVLARKTLEKCHSLYKEHNAEIQKCLTECRNLLELIFPKFHNVFSSHVKRNGPSTSEMEKLHGYGRDGVINVLLPTNGKIKITRNDDTRDLIDSLNDCQVQLESYLKRSTKWLKKLSQAGPVDNSSSSLPSHATLVKRLIDLQQDLRIEVSRCHQLEIDFDKNNDVEGEKICLPKTFTKVTNEKDINDSELHENDDDSGDDDDFIDVEEKEGLELDFDSAHNDLSEAIPHHILEKIRRNKVKQDKDRPGSSGLQTVGKSKRDSGISIGSFDSVSTNSDKSSDLFGESSNIPKLSFGLDLKYWGQSVEPAEHIRNQFDCHNFWRASDIENSSLKESAESYSSRMMTFVGERPSIDRMCRAPLSNGKLCPRMDRYRCPAHGEIVSRDAAGQLIDIVPESSANIKEMKSKQNLSELFGNDDFLHDIESATGVSLASKSKRNVRKKRKLPTSIELRDRLVTKLLDKRTVRRVTQVMDEMQKARAERNFAHQFNYALQNHRA